MIVSKWGSEGYGVDRRCRVAEVKGVTEFLGSTGLGGVAELSEDPELGGDPELGWRSGVEVEVCVCVFGSTEVRSHSIWCRV